jgi:hypothetical protein
MPHLSKLSPILTAPCHPFVARRGTQAPPGVCSCASMRGRRAHVRFCGRRWYIEAFLPRYLSASAKSIESRRADSNRLPLLQLRVIGQALQGYARDCKLRISKRLSLLRFARCCTVLRSRWYQSGIRSTCSTEFANSEKGISCLPLPPVRRIQPHPASSPSPVP